MSVEFHDITRQFEKGTHSVFPGLCKGCGLCIVKCPTGALSWSDSLGVYGTTVIEPNSNCTSCGICEMVCPDCAIAVIKK